MAHEDSGTAEAPIVYRAYENENADADRRAKSRRFVPHQGQILKADVAAQGFKGVYFRQLFFDGQRQHLARYPNFDPQNPYGGGWAYADGKPVPMYQDMPGENRRTLHYKRRRRPHLGRPEEGEVFIFPRYNWWNNIVPHRRRSTATTRTITLAGDCSYADPARRPLLRAERCSRNSTRRASGISTARRGTLYFWPPAPLDGKPVYAPTLRTLVEIGPGTSHVTLRGFDHRVLRGHGRRARRTRPTASVAGSTIRNVGDYSGSGVAIDGGTAQRRGRQRHLRDRQPRHRPQRRRPQDAHAGRATTPTTTTSTTSACSTSRASASALTASATGPRTT